MKTITVNVSEPVYRSFQAYAKSHDRTTSELIREAMATYCKEHLRTSHSLHDVRPVSVGRVIRPLSPEDDLLEEMIDDPGN